jgi:uncharacterized membrane protein YkvI
MNNNKIDWKNVMKIMGAFVAFQIGAGFATGQEVVQYYGSFGGWYWLILPILVFIVTALYSITSFKAGMNEQFADPNMVYDYYCGDKFGKIVNIVTNVTIAGATLVMFSGAGSTISQYFGVSQWVGAVLMGVIAAVIVCLGLEGVTDALGGMGVVIIATLLFVGIYSICTADAGIMESSKNMLKYVDEGIFFQMQSFGLHNPFLSALSLLGLAYALIITFNVTLGQRCQNTKTCYVAAIVSSFFYFCGIMFTLIPILLNLDDVVKNGAEVPMLGVVKSILPFFALPYAAIIVTGILSSVTGYLWVVGRRVGEDKSARQRIVVIIIAAIGSTVASFIPLGKLMNILYPIVGYAGTLLLILAVIKEVRLYMNKKKVQ